MSDPLVGFGNAQLRFESLLGRGAMGAVYKGVQIAMERPVAIKVIATHLAEDQAYIVRFEREAKTLGKVVHPNVITCHDVGPTAGPGGDRLYVMVLEFVDGMSLGRLINGGQRLTVRQVLDLHRQAAEGLAAAHQQGVVHRDVKPDNIMVTRNGQAKVADFGLAKAEDSAGVTQSGAVLGSPAYMAPEACRGEPAGPPADVYSLGCSLFQSLCGSTPYNSATSLQALHQHVYGPVPRVSERRPDLAMFDDLLARLLAKQPGDRPDAAAAAREMRAAIPLVDARVEAGDGGGLAAAVAGLTTDTSPPAIALPDQATVATAVATPAQIPRWWWIAGGAAAILALAVVVPLLGPGRRPLPPPAAPLVATATVDPEAVHRAAIARDLDHVGKALDDAHADVAAQLLADCAIPDGSGFATLRDRKRSLATRLAATRARDAEAVAAVAGARHLDAAEQALVQGDLAKAEHLLADSPAGASAERRQKLRARLDAALAKLHDGIAGRLAAIAGRVAGGDPAALRSETEAVTVPPCFDDLVKRRDGLLQDIATRVAARPQVEALVGDAALGNWLAAPGWPDAPGLRPFAARLIASGFADGRQQLRVPLPGDAAGGCVALLLAGDPGEVEVGIEQADGTVAGGLPTLRLAGGDWQLVSLPIAGSGRVLRLSRPARRVEDARIWLAGAVAVRDRAQAGVAELGMVPGSCVSFPGRADRFRGLLIDWCRARAGNPDLSRVRVLMPEQGDGGPAAREAFAGEVTRGLGCAADGRLLMGYALRGEGLRAPLERAMREDPHLLLIVMPTGGEPGFAANELASCQHLAGKGVLPVIVLAAPGPDAGLRRTWQVFCADLRRAAPGLPILDLGAGSDLLAGTSGLERLAEHALAAGLSELADRIAWELGDGGVRMEAAREPPGRDQPKPPDPGKQPVVHPPPHPPPQTPRPPLRRR